VQQVLLSPELNPYPAWRCLWQLELGMLSQFCCLPSSIHTPLSVTDTILGTMVMLMAITTRHALPILLSPELNSYPTISDSDTTWEQW
jgi:hypothetical protein